MPRPQKKRHVCCEPENNLFTPKMRGAKERVVLTVDEYETIRLIDYEKLNQEETSEQMHISRTTVQGIYMSARSKISDALVNGKELFISGGDYIICNHHEKQCQKGCNKPCCMHQCNRFKEDA